MARRHDLRRRRLGLHPLGARDHDRGAAEMSAALIALAAMLAATAPAPAGLVALPVEDAQIVWYRIHLGVDCTDAFEVLLPYNVLTECEAAPSARPPRSE